ncbi:MAG TPA: hypothetical protein DCY07_02950, partial [Rhodospirillaceae bacterium]|nr:hypothetical protein [Rhodospirillaceae bacterium]
MLFSAQDIANLFDPRDRSRGHIYQTQGHVKDLQQSDQGKRLTALVQGTARTPYRVDIEVIKRRDGRINFQSYCTCPVGYMCKHGSAVLLEAIAQDSRKHERIGEYGLGKRKAGSDALSPKVTRWLKQLNKDDVTHEQADSRIIYILTQDERHGPNLTITPYSQHLLRDGTWGAKKNIGYGHSIMIRQNENAADDQDKAIFYLLKEHQGSQMPHTVWSFDSDGDYIDFILRRVIQTQHAFLGSETSPPLMLGAPEPAELTWTLTPDMMQVPTVAAKRRDLITMMFVSPWYVNSSSGEIGRLECTEDVQTVAQFLKAPPVSQNEAPVLRAAMEKIEAPVPSPFKIRDMKEKVQVPKAQLTLIQGKEGTAGAKLSFTYGDKAVAPTTPQTHYAAVEDDEIHLYKRNLKAEAALLAKLSAHQLTPAPLQSSDYSAAQHSLLVPQEDASPWFWLDFQHVASAHLKDDGIEIVDETTTLQIIEPDSNDIEASFSQSGDWWFSMDLGIMIGGQRVPLLPVLVGMLRKLKSPDDIDRLTEGGKCYAPLPDGRTVALPADRIRTILKTLVELFDDKALDDDGKLRVSMDLTAAFLKLEAITRKRWLGEGHLRKLVEKLGDFEGIKKHALPKGLKATLRPYQIDGYNWLHFLGEYGLSGILADDMGLGKTIQAIAYIQSLKEKKKIEAPCLIVMPTSLVSNWQTEAERFAPDLKILTLHGKERLPRFDKTHHYDIVLTTYPLLPRDGEKLAKIKWSLVILDEAQAIKNPAAKMTQAACSLQAKQRLCLTGTPVENHLGEAWSLFTFLMPGLLGDHKGFTKHYRTPIEKDGDDDRKNL